MDKIGCRLRKLLDDKGVTPYVVSVETKIPQATLSRILNGITKKPGIDNMDLLANYFHVNRDWLITGKGEMLKQAEPIGAPSTNNADAITIPMEAWDVIRNQAASLKAKDEQMADVISSLKARDRQVDEVIALLKEQIKNG